MQNGSADRDEGLEGTFFVFFVFGGFFGFFGFLGFAFGFAFGIAAALGLDVIVDIRRSRSCPKLVDEAPRASAVLFDAVNGCRESLACLSAVAGFESWAAEAGVVRSSTVMEGSSGVGGGLPAG